MGDKKVKKIKESSNTKVAKVIATMMVISAVGVISIDTAKHIKIGTLDTEDVYVTQAVTYSDFVAYAEMVNYEIEQDGGSVTFDDVILIDGDVSEKSVIYKLNSKYSRREPSEIIDEKERKQYKLSRDILMKKSENFPIEYLIDTFESEEPISTKEVDTNLTEIKIK